MWAVYVEACFLTFSVKLRPSTQSSCWQCKLYQGRERAPSQRFPLISNTSPRQRLVNMVFATSKLVRRNTASVVEKHEKGIEMDAATSAEVLGRVTKSALAVSSIVAG